MRISTKAWLEYIRKMSAISKQAADLMKDWVAKNGFSDDKAFLDYAYAISLHYGKAIGALSCDMYEKTAAAQGAVVPSAEIAELPDYGEVAKIMRGAKKQSDLQVPRAMQRIVKQIGADTTRKNVARDGAEFAWVPFGDTCAFCITLASRGWQYEDPKNKRPRAEHIHANCDCQYAVRFDRNSTVEGYDPEVYKDMYYNAGPGSPEDKIKALRIQLTERQRVINHVVKYGENARYIDKEYMKSQKYRMAFRGITGNHEVDDKICQHARKILESRDGSQYESLVLIDKNTGNIIGAIENSAEYDKIDYDEKVEELIQKAHSKGKTIISIHNHPDGYPPTADDCESAGIRGYDTGVVVGHNGKIYTYKPSKKGWNSINCEDYHNAIAYQADFADDDEQMVSIWIDMMNGEGFEVKEVN